MKTIKELKEERAALAARMSQMLDVAEEREAKGFTAEERAKYDGLKKEYETLDERIALREEDEARAAASARRIGGDAGKTPEERAARHQEELRSTFIDYVRGAVTKPDIKEEMRAELFTGNTMIVMTAASKRIKWSAVWKNWIVVFFGNFLGALVIVGLVFLSDMSAMNGGQVGQTMVSVAAGKMHADWLMLFAKGIMCNFLVCLGVWMAYASKTVADKILAVVFPISAFVACGFEHCVANMFFLPMGALLASCGIAPAGIDPASVNMLGALYNWSATVPGNIVGGALMVGMMYWFIYRKKKN